MWVAEVHADPIDQNALADCQRRQHRAARNAIGLDYPLLDAKREPERHENDHDQLDDRARGRLRALGADLHAGSSPVWTPLSSTPGSEECCASPAADADVSDTASSSPSAEPSPPPLVAAGSRPPSSLVVGASCGLGESSFMTASSAVMPSASVAPAAGTEPTSATRPGSTESWGPR